MLLLTPDGDNFSTRNAFNFARLGGAVLRRGKPKTPIQTLPTNVNSSPTQRAERE